MGGVVAIVLVMVLAQMVAQQAKVLGLLCGDLQPVVVILLGHAIKAPYGIQRQIDGVEFNMRNGVDQDSPAFDRAGRATRYGRVVPEFGPGRTAR